MARTKGSLLNPGTGTFIPKENILPIMLHFKHTFSWATQLVPYFTTAEDSSTAKVLRVCDAVVGIARIVPIGAEVNLGVCVSLLSPMSPSGSLIPFLDTCIPCCRLFILMSVCSGDGC
jgi:hypothetical protein